jgi:hypothetical protein
LDVEVGVIGIRMEPDMAAIGRVGGDGGAEKSTRAAAGGVTVPQRAASGTPSAARCAEAKGGGGVVSVVVGGNGKRCGEQRGEIEHKSGAARAGDKEGCGFCLHR